MALRQTITDKFSIILRCLDPSNELLGTLRSVTFVRDRIPSIVQQTTINDKTNALLTALSEVPDDVHESVMHDFIAALRANGQDHVANIFHHESDKVFMSDAHYRLLNKKMYEICQFLEPRDGLIDCLLSSEVFTSSNSDILQSKLPLDDMARETIKILQRKSDDSFEKFISALRETKQDHVVHILTGTGRSPMSKEHRELLQSKKEELEMFCDPVNGVISALTAARAINPREESRIRSKSDLNEMARELVETLTRKPDDAFDAFLKALDKAGQSHVTYILTGEGDSQPLSEECRAKIIEKRSAVVTSIYANCLVSTLISKRVFSSHDQFRVECQMSNNEKGGVIIDLIARKSQLAFDSFIDTLLECDHEHVAEALLGPEVVAQLKLQFGACKETIREDHVEKELVDGMQYAFENDETEVEQVNGILSSNGISVTHVGHGSIVVKFRCKDHTALASLEKLYTSKQLDQLFTDAFCFRFAEKGLSAFCVEIADEELERHRKLKLMTQEHREALLSSAELGLLAETLTVSDLLLDKLSLCTRRRQAIECAGTRQQQVTTLLDIVSRQPDSAFTQLIDALTTTEQHEAVTIISGDYKYAKKSTASEFYKMDTEETGTLIMAKAAINIFCYGVLLA